MAPIPPFILFYISLRGYLIINKTYRKISLFNQKHGPALHKMSDSQQLLFKCKVHFIILQIVKGLKRKSKLPSFPKVRVQKRVQQLQQSVVIPIF